MAPPVPKVYEAIAAVMLALSKDGISKDRKNQQQGYAFRGIDDVYNELSPILAANKLCILPRIMSRHVLERQTKNGGTLFNVTVEAEFDLISAEDGSKHTIRNFGEAMDSADKATNKAMSAAYKYAAMQAFCIPTEGDNDADAHTPEVAPSRKPTARQADESPFDDDAGPSQREAYMRHAEQTIDMLASESDVRAWWEEEKDRRRLNGLTQADVNDLKVMMKARIGELTTPAKEAA